jgi:CBS domain-containing protein
MTVASILRSKANEVHTILPWKSVREAICQLGGPPRIGALVVTGGDRTLGILTERDIVRGLTDYGSDLLEVPVEKIMSRKVPTCAPTDTVARVMRIMTESRFRHLPVVYRGELVGIVSIGDVVLARVKETELEAAVLRDLVIARS